MTKQPGIILDIDGTILRGRQVIPGAEKAVVALRRRDHPIIFITNPLESPNEQSGRLAAAGIEASPNEIITAPQVLEAYLSQHIPEAANKVDGSIDVCHDYAAATMIEVGKEEKLIAAMDELVEAK